MSETGAREVPVQGCGYAISNTEPIVAGHVSAFVDQGVGRIRLDRPSALNALTTEMVSDIARALKDWDSEDLDAIVVTSTSVKAFCAGGDIRQIRRNTLDDNPSATQAFFRTEYALNARIAHCRTPIVSVIDGICMGGGLGLSIHGQFRVVTENASMAMPENVIGFFPDVGASYFLSRLPGALGMYIGLTGYRLDAVDALYAGLATHYVDSALAHLIPGSLGADRHRPVDETLRLLGPTTPLLTSTLAANRDIIDYCFGATSVDQILGRLRSQDCEWADKTLAMLDPASPQSLAVTHAMITLGRQRDVQQCLDAELDVALSMSRSRDFIEGVRAGLVDKDRSPQWSGIQFGGFDSDGLSIWTELS